MELLCTSGVDKLAAVNEGLAISPVDGCLCFPFPVVVGKEPGCYRLDKRLNCLLVGATPPGSAVRTTCVSYTNRASVRGLASGHRSNRSVLPGYQSLVSG